MKFRIKRKKEITVLNLVKYFCKDMSYKKKLFFMTVMYMKKKAIKYVRKNQKNIWDGNQYIQRKTLFY